MPKQQQLLDQELTYAVIGAFHNAYNKLGAGFLENVYVGALTIELEKAGIHSEREVPNDTKVYSVRFLFFPRRSAENDQPRAHH